MSESPQYLLNNSFRYRPVYLIIDFEKYIRERAPEPMQDLAEGDAGTDVKSHKDGAFVIGDV